MRLFFHGRFLSESWWERWTGREQAINDRIEELGDDAQQAVAGLAAEYGHDLELLQDKEEEYLGIR